MATLKNPKHEAVLRAFIGDAQRVGWKAYAAIYTDSSQRAAETAWSRLLKHAEFAARLSELDKAVAEKVVAQTGITIERIVAELGKLGFANMADYVEVFPEGDLSGLTREQAAAIQELVIDTYMDGAGDDAREVKRVRFKLHDKRGPLTDLLKHLGGLIERHEHTGKDGKPIEHELTIIEAARRIAFALTRAQRSKTTDKPKT